MRKPDPKNAEVTKRTIKARGSPDSNQKLVVERRFGVSSIKKKLLYVSCTVMYIALASGILNGGLPAEFIKDGMYITGGLFISQMLTIMFTKME